VTFIVMTLGMLCLLIPTIVSEVRGSPAIAQWASPSRRGAMEGKEVRFGPASFGILEHPDHGDFHGVGQFHARQLHAFVGLMQLLGMMVNAFYGGCGVGWLNYFIYVIIAVFISGLMVGRTPEFMGHKVEAREVKIAALVTLLSAFLIKGGTALASYILVYHPNANWAFKPSAGSTTPAITASRKCSTRRPPPMPITAAPLPG
jgi:K+-transporting ATPase ATPase A chain